MFGEGISLFELTKLLHAIRQKDLELQVKILNGEWEKFGTAQLEAMIKAISRGDIRDSGEIKLRLYARTI